MDVLIVEDDEAIAKIVGVYQTILNTRNIYHSNTGLKLGADDYIGKPFQL